MRRAHLQMRILAGGTFSFWMLVYQSYCYAQSDTAIDESKKWFCVIEKAAGVLKSDNAKEARPSAINFDERHKRFVLTIKPIVRDQEHRDYCRWNLDHWAPILYDKGTFDPADKPKPYPDDRKKFYDYRYNIKSCFASDQAIIKFFDRESAKTLQSYDFLPRQFEGLAGEWLEMRGDEFEAGERRDSGPVVFTGKCERIQ